MQTSRPQHIQSAIVAYVPVLHEGYFHFIEKHPEATEVYLLPSNITHRLRSLQKDIRAVSAEIMTTALQALFPKRTFFVSNDGLLLDLAEKNITIIMPDEDISHEVITAYFPENKILIESIFLRWDKQRSEKVYSPTPTLSVKTTVGNNTMQAVTNLDALKPGAFMQLAEAEATKSSDWWRQVGAVLVKNGKIVLQTHNTHLPSEQSPYVLGDPRANFHAGEHIELSTAIHAEAKLIAQAARGGIALDGTELYCTTFPCPPCAKLIAESGIKTLYFAEGYSMLDGEQVLQDAGVEVVRVVALGK
jgi:dCMP deaminase